MNKVRLPAEWEPQDAVMLTWPQSEEHWGNKTPAVESVFFDIAKHIAQRQKLVVICKDTDHQVQLITQFQKRGVKTENVIPIIAVANDVWARDHGPIITESYDGQMLGNDFTFNGWGGKYPSHYDNEINKTLLNSPLCSTLRYKERNITLEGGGIESNGHGTLLITKGCVINNNRNPGLTEADFDQFFADIFGARKTIWLDHGNLIGDDTDGHIDTLARFISPDTVLAVNCEDPADPHFKSIQAMNNELNHAITADGDKLKVISLPWPDTIRNEYDEILPATYANFLIINEAVLVPTYQQPENDESALKVLKAAFPNREIIGIDALPLIYQYGSIHCVTMQIPRGSLSL